ncbi:MAG: serine hydrolase [Bacillota bacterium]|nr:serine hydrolase [Bacillota bacterium]
MTCQFPEHAMAKLDAGSGHQESRKLNPVASDTRNLSGRPGSSRKGITILSRMYEAKIAGVSAAFIKDGRVIWSGGYGWADLERERPAASP